jgi:hypothetical protein
MAVLETERDSNSSKALYFAINYGLEVLQMGQEDLVREYYE